MPAQAGIQSHAPRLLDSRFRGNDARPQKPTAQNLYRERDDQARQIPYNPL